MERDRRSGRLSDDELYRRILIRQRRRVQAAALKRERIRRVLLTAALIAFTASLAFLAGMKLSVQAARADQTSALSKGYRSVRVERGDTIWSIARRETAGGGADIRDYISEVRSINGIDGDEIHAGSFICVPFWE